MNLLLLGFPGLNFASREAMSENRQLPLDIRRIEPRERCLATAGQFWTWEDRRKSVAATVQQDPRLAQLDHFLEATGFPRLNAQSPSERWDGDWAVSCGALDCFGSIFASAHQRSYWDPADAGPLSRAHSLLLMSTQTDTREANPLA